MAATDEHTVKLTGPGGASATIAYFGATVCSFIPEDGEERLFKSSKSNLVGPQAIRGGIPVVFPCFGPAPKEPPFDKLAQHGFARTSKWTLQKGDDPAVAVFTLESNSDIKQVYVPDFRLTYTIKISAGDVLDTTLEVVNPSSAKEDLKFQAVFHTYFRLPDGTLPSDVTIDKTLKGLDYKDRVYSMQQFKEERDTFVFEGETDRVYANAPNAVVAKYGQSQQGLKLESTGFPDLVTWNPAAQKAATIADMQEEGWKKFICLEPGICESFMYLAPGKTWTGSQKITALSSRLSLPANNAAL